ncbi:MAG: TonB-dependent receptor, partial [Paludibacter sp.]|nr:TonB-dependent receptor [Paludibacter sp.]
RSNGLVLSNLANTRVQWETTARANVGLDLGLFNDRLNVQADFYHSTTSDLLTLQPLPEITGLRYFWSNGGEMTNTGWELAAQLKVLNTRDFQWELGLSAGGYVNEVQSLPDNRPIISALYGGEMITQVGQPYASFYGYKTTGVYKTRDEAEAGGLTKLMNDGSYAPFGAGDMIFEEVVKDGVIDEKDRQIIGNPTPSLYGNFSTRMNYKRWSLNAVFAYSLGNEVYNYYRRNLESGMNYNNQTLAMNRRWTGEDQDTDMPRAVYGDPMGNARFSDRWIEDGSYLRFKNLSIAYELPLNSEFIEGLSVWASGENLYTWSRYLGLDPEVSAGNSVFQQGIDIGLLPPTRSYSIGVKINL